VIQIETPLAIDNAEAIAAIPGVDALFLGPDDILLRRGVAMDAPRTRQMLEPDMTAVARACHAHGKFAVTVAFGAEMQALVLELGFHLMVCGSDVSFLAKASKTASAEARTSIQAGITS
jgi:4-hydroxy-2-oxoheptanedioate aldolase